MTYRIYGCEKARAERYEDVLDNDEKAAVKSNVWQSALPPLYLAVSGAGKSTAFKLLLGLYAPWAGTVTVGGVDVSAIIDGERRACIGCVEQHFSRVPGTVLDQITLGDPGVTADMAKNAARLAGLDETIRALPDGYDTVCTDGIFSQGEWQLLSVARAAAADPAILLLDEITADLDAETEARVLRALRRACAGRTVLSISHRLYGDLGGRRVKIGADDR